MRADMLKASEASTHIGAHAMAGSLSHSPPFSKWELQVGGRCAILGLLLVLGSGFPPGCFATTKAGSRS